MHIQYACCMHGYKSPTACYNFYKTIINYKHKRGFFLLFNNIYSYKIRLVMAGKRDLLCYNHSSEADIDVYKNSETIYCSIAVHNAV